MPDMRASIIIRAYNAETTIRRAIESALAQNFPQSEYEIVIVDDGSTDGTPRIIERYVSDQRVHAVREENKGLVGAANKGFEESRGRFVTLLDADDELLQDFLTATAALLEADASLDFSYSDYVEEFEGHASEQKVENLMHTIAGGILFRRDRLAEAGFYRDVLFAEYDLLLRTMDTWRGAHVPRPLYIYHRRPSGVSAHPEWVRKGIEQLLQLHSARGAAIRTMRSYDLHDV